MVMVMVMALGSAGFMDERWLGWTGGYWRLSCVSQGLDFLSTSTGCLVIGYSGTGLIFFTLMDPWFCLVVLKRDETDTFAFDLYLIHGMDWLQF